MTAARKRGLGRGLEALLREDEPGGSTLPLARLKPNRFQPRAEFDSAVGPAWRSGTPPYERGSEQVLIQVPF